MRQISWLIGLSTLIFGHTIWQVSPRNFLIRKVDRTFEDWLVDTNKTPLPAPVPVTLVEMEDAANWTALEYCLFLKNLPTEVPPIVILTSVPPPGETAFDRAFVNLALRQPRLILPVKLATKPAAPGESFWWLKGLPASTFAVAGPVFGSVKSYIPESLQGTVATGVLTQTYEGRAPLFVPLNDEIIPSLGLRAVMLVEKIVPDLVHFDGDLFLGNRRIRVEKDHSLAVDESFLPGIRRILSSDLMLGSTDQRTAEAVSARLRPDPLQGVVVLGDFSPTSRIPGVDLQTTLTPAEWTALTVATICNGSPLAPLGDLGKFLILLGGVFFPWALSRQSRGRQWFAAALWVGIYLLVTVYLAGHFALAAPLFLPVAVVFFGTALHQFTIPRQTRPHA